MIQFLFLVFCISRTFAVKCYVDNQVAMLLNETFPLSNFAIYFMNKDAVKDNIWWIDKTEFKIWFQGIPLEEAHGIIAEFKVILKKYRILYLKFKYLSPNFDNSVVLLLQNLFSCQRSTNRAVDIELSDNSNSGVWLQPRWWNTPKLSQGGRRDKNDDVIICSQPSIHENRKSERLWWGKKVAQYWPEGKLLSEFYRVCSSPGDSGERWPDAHLQKLWTFVSVSFASHVLTTCKTWNVKLFFHYNLKLDRYIAFVLRGSQFEFFVLGGYPPIPFVCRNFRSTP